MRLHPPTKLPDEQYTPDDYKKYIAWCPMFGTFDSRWLNGEPPFAVADDGRAEIIVDVLLLDEEEFI